MKNLVSYAPRGQKSIFLSSIRKRIVVLLLLIVNGVMAYASTYSYMVFTSTSGAKTAFSVENLCLTVNGSQLHISNDTVSINFMLADLVSMQFSNENSTTSLENVLNVDAMVEVYSISGAFLSNYPSLVEAALQLGTGTYVISNGSVSQIVIIKN